MIQISSKFEKINEKKKKLEKKSNMSYNIIHNEIAFKTIVRFTKQRSGLDSNMRMSLFHLYALNQRMLITSF